MDEDNINIKIRQFLKKVGITSQREIEKSIFDAHKNGKIKKGDEIKLKMNLKIDTLNIDHTIDDKIIIE